MCYVNKMDRTGANFWRTVGMIEDRLRSNAIPIQLPIGSEANYKGIVDLITSRAIIYTDDLGTTHDETDIPADLVDEAKKHREKLVEAIAETDDELMMMYLEGETIPVDKLIVALRKATLANKLVPVLCGSSLKNKGVQPMLDAVVAYLPSPLDKPPITGILPGSGEEVTRPTDENAPFSALVFKIVSDPFVGRLAYFRVYSGKLEGGSYTLNSSKNNKERVARLMQMHANHREEIDTVYAGDIAAIVGLKNTFTGDTICDPNHPIILEQIVFPEPVISQSIEPKTKADQDKMAIALQRLAEEDPTFRVHTDSETGQTIIAGMGELHLDVLTDRMKREFRVEANVGRPQVAYRETITQAVRAEGRHVKQTGGKGQYGHVVVQFEPNEAGKGFEFTNGIVGGTVPREYVPAVEKGIRDNLGNAGRAGYPIVDIKAKLVDGSFHAVDSSEMAFSLAAILALKEAIERGRPIILEPIMKIEITTPEQWVGDMIGDLNRRRGHVESMESMNGVTTVRGFVPLANMFGYATDIRSKTQGRASYSMEFDHYGELPRNLAEELVAKVRK
jgi:elongation factor G